MMLDEETLINVLQSDDMHEALRNSGCEDKLTAAVSDAISAIQALVDVEAECARLRSTLMQRGRDAEAARQALAWFEAREPYVRAVVDAWVLDYPEHTALHQWEQENEKTKT